MVYDVAIVGAGPAGLMAARTAAENGLKTVLIEKRHDITAIKRACCMQLKMDEDYEGETIRVKERMVVFPRNGFAVDYYGPLLPLTHKYYISPGGRRIHFAYRDRRPIIIKFDKGHLLQNLLRQCEDLGVEVRSGTKVCAAEDGPEGVKLKTASARAQSAIQVRKLIAADGVNAQIAETLGMNSGRRYFATGMALIHYVKGIRGFDPTAWKSYFGLAYQSRSPIMITSSLLGDDVASVVTIGSRFSPPRQIFADCVARSPLAPLFKSAKIVGKRGCSAKAYTSLQVPHRGNVLIIGDAAAYVEIEVQGALMTGFRAGNAVAKELQSGDGFREYTGWWQRSFEFNSDTYLQVAQGFALVPAYTDDELDYLFSLIEDEELEGTYSQYKSPRIMWDAILRHEGRIAADRPDLHQKIKHKKLTLRDILLE
jgi:flavin-dependent dehydrogenase